MENSIALLLPGAHLPAGPRIWQMRGAALAFLVAVAVLATGCGGLRQGRAGLLPGFEDAEPLRPGDVVVAADRGRGTRHALVRLRLSRSHDGTVHVHSQVLATLPGTLSSVAVSPDGRWVAEAVAPQDAPPRVDLLDMHDRQGEQPAWRSPDGCQAPAFDPASRWMAIGCTSRDGQPAAILQVDLGTRAALFLVGERDRVLPAAGVDGDLYWVETDGERFRVVRRSGDGFPYSTHELLQPLRSLWPQDDGSLLAEIALPGDRREFVRLARSGVVRDEPLPHRFPRNLSRGVPLSASAQGTWFGAMCDRGPCSLLHGGGANEAVTPIGLGGLPTALCQVPWIDHRTSHPEDLATAPASVFGSHAATQVSVLGVDLGTPMETAFSHLDRAGLHPYWIDADGKAPRTRPRGIGLGWTSDGHCVEYLADERGVIVSVDMKACAGGYLSGPLRPLLDRDSIAHGPLEVASRFLGPGVAVIVGDDDTPAGDRPPIRRTEVVYTAPDRGYHFEAHTEVLATQRSRVLGGWVWLRLQLPGRRQAAAARPR